MMKVTERQEIPESSISVHHKETVFLWLNQRDQIFVGILCTLTFSILSGYWSRQVEAEKQSATGKKNNRQIDHRLDVNTASETQLMLLNGIGPALSRNIVVDRKQNGLFATIANLRRVKGIGSKKLEAIRPFVMIDSRTIK